MSWPLDCRSTALAIRSGFGPGRRGPCHPTLQNFSRFGAYGQASFDHAMNSVIKARISFNMERGAGARGIRMNDLQKFAGIFDGITPWVGKFLAGYCVDFRGTGTAKTVLERWGWRADMNRC